MGSNPKVELVDKLFELLSSSTVTEGTLSLVLIVGSLYVQVVQGAVPTWLVGADLLVLGHFFGAKQSVALQQSLKSLQQALAETVKP